MSDIDKSPAHEDALLGTPVKDKGLDEYYRKSGRASHAVKLEWKNISYNIAIKDPITGKYMDKKVLDNVSGHAESGQLLAILGPSGCGKTSLMNILASKLPAGGSEFQSLSGSVTVNGRPRNEEQFRSASSYVLQDDFMYPHLTVLEVLTLASHFYCPSSMDDEDKAELVNAVIMELGLVKAKDTLIGNDRVRGVSGGERKRCNIGIQLITDPAILFLDEPTTGLDSFQALAVMECIKGLALNGRLVVAVIHQPRSQIYSMFDHMLLLSAGKSMFYGKAASAVDYFERAGHACPEEFNPADHYLDLLSPDNRSKALQESSVQRVQQLAQYWDDHGQKQASGSLDAESGQAGSLMSNMQIGQDRSCGSFFMQLKHLSWRTYTEVKRDWITLVIGCTIFCLFGLLIGGVYSDIGFTQVSLQNRDGCLFFIGVNCTFNGLFSVLNVFPKEKNIVNTERANRAYDLTPYFLAKFFIEIPARCLPAVLYGTILYPMVGLREGAFGTFLLVLISVSICSVSLGLLISAVMPSFEAAIGVGPLFVVVMILFGGFYIDIDSLPEVANLVPYVSILRWSFQALAINEYTGLTFTCVPNEQCISSGEQKLATLGFGGKSVSYALGGIWIMCFAIVAAAYMVLLASHTKYSPLNFTGAKYVAIVSSEQTAGTAYGKETELVATSAEEADKKESVVE